MNSKPSDHKFLLIGTGRLARALALSFPDRIAAVAGRTVEQARQVTASARNAVALTGTLPDPEGYDAVWIATSDEAIARISAEYAVLRPDWHGVAVIHSSGTTSPDALHAFAGRGAVTLALHPNLALTGQAPIPSGAFWSLSARGIADEDGRILVEKLLSGLAPQLIYIPDEMRALYHAAASVAANYSVTLFAMAAELYRRAGVGESAAVEIVRNFIMTSIERASKSGPAAALTGPAARGDAGTLAAQQESVETHAPEFAEAFAALTRLTRISSSPVFFQDIPPPTIPIP